MLQNNYNNIIEPHMVFLFLHISIDVQLWYDKLEGEQELSINLLLEISKTYSP